MNKITIRQLTASTLLWLAASVIVAFATNAAHAQGTPNKLESIDVQNISGQQVQLTLHHASPPSDPVAFTIDNPARISLDLANTALALPSRRNPEFLEQFSLDTLRMVGTLRLSDRTYGLIKTKDGLVHRVLPGNYLGQADGRVTEISPSKISVVEIVPDGLGGYMERPASLALN